MSERVFNFNPGPAILPLPVIQEAQQELLNFKNTGMSILEVSHRSKEYEEVQNETESMLKELLGAPSDYRVLFMGGGASSQFALIPMNFLSPGTEADYIISGIFAEKAYEEAARVGKVNIAASTKGTNFDRVPEASEIKLSANPAFVHITSNNTIYGTQWAKFPELKGVPVVADMSSDILSRPIDASRFSLIYAGAQKNLGPSGVTVVVISPELLTKANAKLPVIFQYGTFVKNNSLYNTPPTFAVYVINLVLKWLKNNGGVAAMEERNKEKAAYVYHAIDNSGGFYKGHAQKGSRSLMNVTFRLPSEELENTFAGEAKKDGLVGLKGHRSVGGMRASIYNAMPIEGCKALAEFMKEFQRKNG
jgi:phosphoserine aminotransferase